LPGGEPVPAEPVPQMEASNRGAADLARELVAVQAAYEEMQTRVRLERVKVQSATRDAEKIEKKANVERQSIVEVLNDLLAEYTALRKSSSHKAIEAAQAIRQRDEAIANYQTQLHDVTAALEQVRESISFRVLVALGRPIAAARKLLRSNSRKP
jgi:hypothetical protein